MDAQPIQPFLVYRSVHRASFVYLLSYPFECGWAAISRQSQHLATKLAMGKGTVVPMLEDL